MTESMVFNTPHSSDDARGLLAQSSVSGSPTTRPSQESSQSRSGVRTETQSLSLPPIAEWYDARRDTGHDARPAMRYKTPSARCEASTEATRGAPPTQQSNGMSMYPDSFTNVMAGYSGHSQQPYPTQTTEYGLPKPIELPERSAMARRDSSVACWTAISPDQRAMDGDPSRSSYMSNRPPIQESIMSGQHTGNHARHAMVARDTAGSYYSESYSAHIKREHAHGQESVDLVNEASHMPLAHEASICHAEGNPTILTYLPGLLPAAAGRKNRGYIGVEVINGQKFHVYEGGLCLPYEVNGERVNEWWGLTKANIPRKRLATACDRCREKKVRCEPGVEGCLQCQRAHATCLRNMPQPNGAAEGAA